MTAGHTVPQGIGPLNAAKIFEVSPEEGLDVIWNERNGLLLYSEVEKALDAARLVIVPNSDSVSEAEFKTVLLDETIQHKEIDTTSKLT